MPGRGDESVGKGEATPAHLDLCRPHQVGVPPTEEQVPVLSLRRAG